MLQNLFKTVIALLLVAGCATDEVKDADVNANDSNVATQDLNFDSMGSDSGNIAGLTTVNFGYDQATITASARAELNQNAEWINNNPNVTVQIEGHCDARGSIEYNLALGERRARAVKDYLVSQGVDGSRLSIISYGKEKLLDSSDSESAHMKNRRANFVPLAK
ncbi:MAG: OmpA family protein [Bdellovibrionota bacterium]|nr:peptidoglycan-associated lipoprotein [Pseudobdellovibrionaceae bacterium]|tara:strand:+ start:24096 stop:24587 length:492 start_codon:yes stop_codon:yes gene_type:complete